MCVFIGKCLDIDDKRRNDCVCIVIWNLIFLCKILPQLFAKMWLSDNFYWYLWQCHKPRNSYHLFITFVTNSQTNATLKNALKILHFFNFFFGIGIYFHRLSFFFFSFSVGKHEKPMEIKVYAKNKIWKNREFFIFSINTFCYKIVCVFVTKVIISRFENVPYYNTHCSV